MFSLYCYPETKRRALLPVPSPLPMIMMACVHYPFWLFIEVRISSFPSNIFSKDIWLLGNVARWTMLVSSNLNKNALFAH